MMVKPSSKINRAQASMENHKIKEPDHLSGAYIRSLVKHLTSIKPKDSSTANDLKLPESADSNGDCIIDHNNTQQESPPPAPVKKQVRRRRHTSKPYQERLLNMAEARREIVTALKFHRASMKQRETEGNGYPQSSTSTTITSDLSSNYLDSYSNLSSSPYYYRPVSGPPPLPPLNYHENLDLTLPNQTLGLNLNLQDFINLDANLYHNPLSNHPMSSSSSSSTSLSAAISAVRMPEEVVPISTTTSSSSSSSSSRAIMNGDMLHQVMDDEGMEEIRSLGEQHQMEWNDTVNLMTSARWFKFLKNIEIDGKVGLDDEIDPFSQVIEYPPW